MNQQPTTDQLLAAVDRAVENMLCRRLTDEERALFSTHKEAFVELAKRMNVPLRTLLAEFRFELCKATGNVVISVGQSGTDVPAARSLQ